MTRKLERDVSRRCQECDSNFHVTYKNFKKVFCDSDCRDKYHNRLKCEVLRERNRRSNHDSRVTEEDS